MIYFCNMVDRIKEILKREDLSLGTFADEIGVQRSSLSHILNGRNNPSLDFIIKTLQRFPMINSEWLLMGKGNMFTSIEGVNTNELDRREMQRKDETTDLFSAFSPKSASPAVSESTESIVKPIVNEVQRIEKSERYVSQILIFYSDSTYQVYKPEKPE